MQTSSLFFVFLALVPALVRAQELPKDQKLGLFLLIGQSNMAGRGTIEPQDQIPDPQIWKLDKDDKWVPAIDPLHFDKPKVAGVGLGMTFARIVNSHDRDHFIGLVPSAVGGTTINQWARGSELYNEAVRRCKIAQEHGTLRGILWHQGESDSTEARVPTYLAHLNAIIEGLRQDLNAPEVPLVVGQIGTFHIEKAPFTKQMNETLEHVSDVIKNSGCASSAGLTDIGDHTHFNAASQRELGRRYAAVYLKLTGATTQPTTKP